MCRSVLQKCQLSIDCLSCELMQQFLDRQQRKLQRGFRISQQLPQKPDASGAARQLCGSRLAAADTDTEHQHGTEQFHG